MRVLGKTAYIEQEDYSCRSLYSKWFITVVFRQYYSTPHSHSPCMRSPHTYKHYCWFCVKMEPSYQVKQKLLNTLLLGGIQAYKQWGLGESEEMVCEEVRVRDRWLYNMTILEGGSIVRLCVFAACVSALSGWDLTGLLLYKASGRECVIRPYFKNPNKLFHFLNFTHLM